MKIISVESKKKYMPIWMNKHIQNTLSKMSIDFELYDSGKTYNNRDIFAINPTAFDKNTTPKHFYEKNLLVELHGESLSGNWGEKHIDNPDVLFSYGSENVDNKINVVSFEKFFWCEPSTEWYDRYYNFIPNNKKTKKFLMPIRNCSGRAEWRKHILNGLKEHLDESIYSFFPEGIYLPGSNKKSRHREINLNWFDDTHFSLVLESYFIDNWPMFITEKTFKPIAFKQPFMVIGKKGLLKKIKSYGFETFENLFNESYDLEVSLETKFQIIKENINRYDYKNNYDLITLEKIEHNHQLFFDQKKVADIFEKEFVIPVLEYFETKS